MGYVCKDLMPLFPIRIEILSLSFLLWPQLLRHRILHKYLWMNTRECFCIGISREAEMHRSGGHSAQHLGFQLCKAWHQYSAGTPDIPGNWGWKGSPTHITSSPTVPLLCALKDSAYHWWVPWCTTEFHQLNTKVLKSPYLCQLLEASRTNTYCLSPSSALALNSREPPCSSFCPFSEPATGRQSCIKSQPLVPIWSNLEGTVQVYTSPGICWGLCFTCITVGFFPLPCSTSFIPLQMFIPATSCT